MRNSFRIKTKNRRARVCITEYFQNDKVCLVAFSTFSPTVTATEYLLTLAWKL